MISAEGSRLKPTIDPRLHMSVRFFSLITLFALVLAEVTGSAAPSAAQSAADNRAALIGRWVLNRELSGPTPSPDFGARRGGSRGRGFAIGGGRGSPTSDNRAAARAEGERLVALMAELVTPETKLEISSAGGQTLAFTSGDGRTVRYTADNKVEKHQQLNGVIETRSKWIRDELRQEINAADVIAMVKSFAVDPATDQLTVTTALANARRDDDRPTRVVYEREPN
jgi:hypothetical protein